MYLLCLSILSLHCNEKIKKAGHGSTSGQSLVGEWNNVYLKVETISKSNGNENEVLEVRRDEWEARLKIKPIRSFFREDSTWNSAHYNLNDSLVYDPSGKWWTDADRLTMLQTKPSPDTTIYTFTVKGDTATFEALVDWDRDGKKDDRYFGKQVRAGK